MIRFYFSVIVFVFFIFHLGIAEAATNETCISVRPCYFLNSDLYLDEMLTSSSILFLDDYENVFNAEVAARYTDSFILYPGMEFSFNRTVGKRTVKRGFITGHDVFDNVVVGGGVCRTSTVIYQVAKNASLEILERHPHSLPINYTPPGTDATVSWGTKDLRFNNNLDKPLVIHSGIIDENKGRRLWAELWLREPLSVIEVNILNIPDLNVQTNEKIYAIVKGDTSYISIEQLSDIFHIPYEIKEIGGIFKLTLNVNNKFVNYSERSNKVIINNNIKNTKPPFRLLNCNCKYWLPLRGIVDIMDESVCWTSSPKPEIILKIKDNGNHSK